MTSAIMRTTSSADLILIRHAEAFKNLARVHGGGDQRLTPSGENQAKRLGQYILSINEQGADLNIIHQPEGRCKSTAEIIGHVASCTLVEALSLRGVGLGATEGLSEVQLEKQYPDVATALTKWRQNKGGLGMRPKVPGSERMEDFAVRIMNGLTDLFNTSEEGKSLAIVGTTSTLNMVNHLLINDGNFSRSNYDFIEFPLGSFTKWQTSVAVPKNTIPITVP